MSSIDKDIGELFYHDTSLPKYVAALRSASILDAFVAKENMGSYAQAFREKRVPIDLLYQLGSHFFNDLSFSMHSSYSSITIAELQTFAGHISDYVTYFHPNIIDIGCGNGKKAAFLLKKIKDTGIDISAYTGIDSVGGSLRVAEDMIQQTIPGLRTSFRMGNFLEKSYGSDKPQTLLFLGGTYNNLSAIQQKEFLQHCFENMQSGDTLIIDVSVVENNSLGLEQIDDEKLQELQKEFFLQEKNKYQKSQLCYDAKEDDIRHLQGLGVENISHEDIVRDIHLDEADGILYDVVMFHKDIYVAGTKIIGRYEPIFGSGILLDRSFFVKYNENMYKCMVESLYSGPDADNFIYHTLSYFGITPDNSYIEYVYEDDAMKIYLSFTQDIDIFVNDEKIHMSSGEKLSVMDAKRLTDKDMIAQCTKIGFTVQQNFPITITNPISPQKIDTIMRSYVLQKP